MEEKRYSQLTNEQISRRFKSQFDLVNHAIRLAGHLIHSGHAPGPGSADNIVNDVLTDIKYGRDFYRDLDDEEEEEEDDADLSEIFSSKDKEKEEEESPPAKKSRAKALLKK